MWVVGVELITAFPWESYRFTFWLKWAKSSTILNFDSPAKKKSYKKRISLIFFSGVINNNNKTKNYYKELFLNLNADFFGIAYLNPEVLIAQ